MVSERTIEQQIADGRAGLTNEIYLESVRADDVMFDRLSASDTWLKVIRLDNGSITDNGIESIVRLPSLQHLRLRKSPITDQGFAALAGCESLHIINLPQCDASSAGVRHLIDLPELWNLRLGGKRLGAETALEVAQIKTLRNLHLIGVPVDDDGLRRIAELPDLESLYLDDAEVSASGWDWLFENHSDLHLHVNQRHLDRDPSTHD